MVGREGTLRSGEVAELLGVGGRTVAKWVKEGGQAASPSGRCRTRRGEKDT